MANESETSAVQEMATAFKALLDQANSKPAAKRKEPPGVEWSDETRKIVLPGNPTRMSLPEAKEWLQKAEEADHKVVEVNEEVDAYPWDGAVAFMQACREMFGYVDVQSSFFQQATLIAVETGVNQTEHIFWGSVVVPGIDGTISTGVIPKRGRMIFTIHAHTRQKHVPAVRLLADRTRAIVKAGGIYRGKAIKLHTDDGEVDWNSAPSFLDFSRVKPEELIFSEDLMLQVETNVLTPIKHTELCRAHGIPLKRGVLLAGPYGTGKTLLSSVVGKVAPEHGWTFITVDNADALKAALDFAQAYQPAVVFVEDIDSEMEGSDRSDAVNAILNTIDGVSAKTSEVMVILTSNHVEKINRAMLRPGRLDAVLNIDPPDAAAAEKLVRIYGRHLIAVNANLAKSGKALAGMIPAVIREVVERAKLFAISLRPGQAFELTDSDLVAAAATMKRHMALMAEPTADDQNTYERTGRALADMMNHHLGNGSDTGLSAKVARITEKVDEIHGHVV